MIASPPRGFMKLDQARQLAAAGRFADALKALDALAPSREFGRVADVLRAELFERVGRLGQSRSLVESLLRTRDLSTADRSSCEFTLGRLDWESGDRNAAITHIQRSLSLANQVNDLERSCWSQIRLVAILSD